MTPAQQQFIVAHETAHSEPGPADAKRGSAACESCADERAGALLCAWGYTEVFARKGASIIRTRDASSDAVRGWRAMNARRKGRSP